MQSGSCWVCIVFGHVSRRNDPVSQAFPHYHTPQADCAGVYRMQLFPNARLT